MHGADGSSAELRPASIKGVLRFWWRAIHGNLSLDELHEQEGKIFGSKDKRSSFSIKIQRYEGIPKEFTIQFLNHGTFDIQSFFELVVILGFFGQKGQGKQKIQGSIKITDIDKQAYTQKVTLSYIDTLLQKVTANFLKQKFEITQTTKLEAYPLIEKISISRTNELYVNFTHSTKFTTIKKDLKAYNG
jgi:CRISPR type III-B/RAMP module RAMP protein Cmr1